MSKPKVIKTKFSDVVILDRASTRLVVVSEDNLIGLITDLIALIPDKQILMYHGSTTGRLSSQPTNKENRNE